jgi:hypothetical protein
MWQFGVLGDTSYEYCFTREMDTWTGEWRPESVYRIAEKRNT